MKNEQKIQDYMDGRTSTEENRRLLAALHDSGDLGELLFSEAAAALLDSAAVETMEYSLEYDSEIGIAAENIEEYGASPENQ